MATALIHLNPDQKKQLARRARLRGKSFSQEVRDAISLYLEIAAPGIEVRTDRESGHDSPFASQKIENLTS
jgi:hypothetical protein